MSHSLCEQFRSFSHPFNVRTKLFALSLEGEDGIFRFILFGKFGSGTAEDPFV
jgi:hypothetical protein